MSFLVLIARTLALRQGFQPLSDYRWYVKLTPMGSAVSLPDIRGRRECGVPRISLCCYSQLSNFLQSYFDRAIGPA
ncbi:hypothetical protein [Microcoleus sp. D2_18a_D3]|uniref:hypothetical protein n=1 Tax=Microcoleus sp. D2_18a_D3 TaxID=3055330 RepID=UPI002FD0F98A